MACMHWGEGEGWRWASGLERWLHRTRRVAAVPRGEATVVARLRRLVCAVAAGGGRDRLGYLRE